MGWHGHRFPKGVMSSPNPIKKGEHRGKATEFKKGIVPKNKLPVGSVTTRIQKGDHPRAWVKVAEPNVWIPRAIYTWTSQGGTIARGFVIHHRNHNSLDDSIENLECIKRATHANHHQPALQTAKIGLTLKVRSLPCGKCGKVTMLKKRGSFCHDCAISSRREKHRNYKKWLRAQRRQKRIPDSS